MTSFLEALKAIGIVAAHVAEQSLTSPAVEQALATVLTHIIASHVPPAQ